VAGFFYFKSYKKNPAVIIKQTGLQKLRFQKLNSIYTISRYVFQALHQH